MSEPTVPVAVAHHMQRPRRLIDVLASWSLLVVDAATSNDALACITWVTETLTTLQSYVDSALEREEISDETAATFRRLLEHVEEFTNASTGLLYAARRLKGAISAAGRGFVAFAQNFVTLICAVVDFLRALRDTRRTVYALIESPV